TKEVQRNFVFFRAIQEDVTVIPAASPLQPDVQTPCPYNNPPAVALKSYSNAALALGVGDQVRMYAPVDPSDVFVFEIAPNEQEFAPLDPPTNILLNTLHFPSP